MKKHWFKVFSCVAFIRSTDTYDVIIPVSSSDDASVLRPPSAEAWTDYTSTDHPNQIPAVNFDPRNMQGSHSELQFHLEPVCSCCLACFRLMAIAMISQQININKNKRGKRSTQTASFIAISRLLFITMTTCERASMRPVHRCDRFVFIGYANVLIQCSLLFTAPETNEVDSVCVFAVCL